MYLYIYMVPPPSKTKKDKAFKDISDTQNVGPGGGGSTYVIYTTYTYTMSRPHCDDGEPQCVW